MTWPSLILIHGFLGSASSWDEVLSLLSPGARVERLELLGHGSGPTDDESAVDSFDDEVERLLARVRRAELPSPRWLVGYSLGARVALGLAARAEAPFDGLVLVSGRDGLADAEEARARAAHDDALARELIETGLQAFVARWERLPLFASQGVLPEHTRRAHRARRLAHDPEGVSRALRVLSLGRMPRYASRAFARTPRARLVVGEHDPKFRALADSLGSTYGLERHVVAGAGHDVALERPAALAALLSGIP